MLETSAFVDLSFKKSGLFLTFNFQHYGSKAMIVHKTHVGGYLRAKIRLQIAASQLVCHPVIIFFQLET